MADKKLSKKDMNLLGNLGFDYQEIGAMTKKQMDGLLAKYNQTVSGEVGILAVNPWPNPIPYFGSNTGETTYFHTRVYLSTSAISSYCEDSMDFAEYVFNRTYNYASTKAGQNIRFSYFLYGEQSPGIHEGLDVKDVNSSTRTIKSATPGDVVGPVGGTYGQVRIYQHDYIDETIVYLHMTVSPTILNGTNTDITLGETIGNQGKAGVDNYHLHAQALDGCYTESTIPTGTDTVLVSRIPYFYITFFI